MDLSDSQYYINRELSWLEFNGRVLEEAFDENNLLLERLRFLTITASNLDEFFMVRISGLTQQVGEGYDRADASGMTPSEQLKAAGKKARAIMNRQYDCLSNHLIPQLKANGIWLASYRELSPAEKEFAYRYFHTTLFPILTPMAVDQSRPFPLLSNRALVFLVELSVDGEEEPKLAVVQVPTVIRRIIRLPGKGGKATFIALEEIIRQFIGELFTGHKIVRNALFRITRNSDVEIDEEEAPNLLSEIEESVRQRKWGKPVRVEIEEDFDDGFLKFLKAHLHVGKNDIYMVNGLMDLTACTALCEAKGFDHLRHSALKQAAAVDFKGKNVFDAIAQKDILVHHPYESFDCVIGFVSTAAADPNVLAIKQTLYRVSGNSPIVRALIKAAENGKQVTVLVELKARFDEENNISWARRLERSGCHVVYGLVGLKTHCKACLVVRKEEEGIKRYVHLSTGNYNDSTAKIYTDIGFFTCKESFGKDISALFNALTGYSQAESWQKITVAPTDMRRMFLNEIRRETENAENGGKARIVAKMNSLVDEEIIAGLYEASIAGVEIRLLIRGICCLRPGIAGVSHNIKVFSIVGRFLEHSRIYYFENSGEPKIYLSSADWMPRNLNRRIEIAFPIEDPRLKNELKIILETSLNDTVKLRIGQPDGSYKRTRMESAPELNSQEAFRYMALEREKIFDAHMATEDGNGGLVFTPLL